MIYTPHQIIFRWPNEGEWDRQSLWHTWGRREYGVLVGKLKERTTWKT